MSLTDAISVACKSLGFAADIYWNNDRSKYDRPEETPNQRRLTIPKAQVIYDLLQKTNADVKAFLKYYGVKTVEDMTLDVWTKAYKSITKQIKQRGRVTPSPIWIVSHLKFTHGCTINPKSRKGINHTNN